uniref:Uncharacterized protein n=1 Tax=Meloidogyne hapla TaxID=6305 RepID=A0A1I8BK16_MELHA
MYQHFILISCYATNTLEKQNYCGFVEEQLPQKLVENIDNKLDTVKYCHLWKKIDHCPDIKERMPYCSTWIIGIEVSNVRNINKDIEDKFGELIEDLKQKGNYKVENNDLKFMFLDLSKKNN